MRVTNSKPKTYSREANTHLAPTLNLIGSGEKYTLAELNVFSIKSNDRAYLQTWQSQSYFTAECTAQNQEGVGPISQWGWCGWYAASEEGPTKDRGAWARASVADQGSGAKDPNIYPNINPNPTRNPNANPRHYYYNDVAELVKPVALTLTNPNRDPNRNPSSLCSRSRNLLTYRSWVP